jgi:CRISPR-associated endonuclease/helicase Cas3
MPPLAHSGNRKRGIPPQDYAPHIAGVVGRAERFAKDATTYWTGDGELFLRAVRNAALVHDLGKLDALNQSVLETSERKPLEVGHEHAGVKLLTDGWEGEAATLVYSHHRGLPDLWNEFASKECFRRDLRAQTDLDGCNRADELLDRYLEEHRAVCAEPKCDVASRRNWRLTVREWTGLTWRFALSCLVDADHGDTARHYRQEQDVVPASPSWDERLAALDAYVEGLTGKGDSDRERNRVRQRIYEACREHRGDARIYACDSGVGTGKTTAVMAHLLRVAQRRPLPLRHIFVVLPYTNIINQSVDVYRKALVLEGEDPERVVAAHHHLADYEEPSSRQLATLWDCPITVTTAVQFFETMAAANTSRLRKLHELAGSAVFIDEAHAAIPPALWPQTWKWIEELTCDWGCHFVLGSGSLVRFWEHPGFVDPPANVPNLIAADLTTEVQGAERRRVTYRKIEKRWRIDDLNDFAGKPGTGPWLVIVNTVRSAAQIARSTRNGGSDVLHLSTALTPADREKIIRRIRERLRDRSDRAWMLVATSCVEAGVDLDFRSAIRELASTCSMIQVGGRVNRHSSGDEGEVWVVSFDDPGLTAHPGMKVPGGVLADLFAAGEVERLDAPALCDAALRRELNQSSQAELALQLKTLEEQRNFPKLAKLYRVIDDDMATVVVDPLLQELEMGIRLRPTEVLQGSVRIRRKVLDRGWVRPVKGYPELCAWTLKYDPDLLGYMAGVFESAAAMEGEFLTA